MSGSGQTTIGSGGTLSVNAPGSTVYLEPAAGQRGQHDLDGRRHLDERRHVHEQRQLHGQYRYGYAVSYGIGAGTAACSTTPARSPSRAAASCSSTTTPTACRSTTRAPVDVQEGDLQLETGGTHTGDFSIAAGSTLWLDGTHTFAATSDITGAGTVNVVDGTTTFNGQLSAGNTIARQWRHRELQ